MPKYYVKTAAYGDILFCDCDDGSAMDLAIKDMQRADREHWQGKIQRNIFSGLSTVVPTVKEPKDILKVVKK